MLEIGPGIGVNALPVAASLAPDGVLDVLDVQPEMLDTLAEREAQAGIRNIAATLGDARKLPYPDQTYDAGYLIGVLGEIPDKEAALRELRRVLKLTGRLVVGEILLDPDYVSFATLQELTRRAGFVFDRRLGSRFSYLARFRPAEAPATETAGYASASREGA